MFKKLGQVFAGLKNPRPNLHVLTPLVIPLPSSEFAKKINQRLLVAQIRRALKTMAQGPVQFWTFTPDVGYLLGSFNETDVVYYCVDDHSQFTGYNVAQVLAEEEELCRLADLVVTTSATLQEAKCQFNPKTVMLPHGVDHAHFSQSLTEHLKEPDELASIPSPRLGFFGLIRDWVDLELIASVARRRPDWQFVMVGDSTFDLSPYRLSNIHFLGRKPYDDLPGYCKGFDVGLIPFKINDLTRAVNPIKLREYLAAGLPVVSTPLPEVARYDEWVKIASNATEFENAIEDCLQQNQSAEVAKHRSDAMSTETWESKVSELQAMLADASRNRSDQ
jgi:glycosyltransferase involved in cell wall biosynthesis